MKKNFGNITLLITALIWGVAFVAQSSAMDSVGPWSFLAARSVLGGAFLIPVIFIIASRGKKNDAKKSTREDKRALWCGGILCGVALCVASALQQIGIQYCEPGKAGFITAMYILLVPIAELFFGKRATARMWICVALGAVGLYFLCMKSGISFGKKEILGMSIPVIKSGFSFEKGDIYLLLCAVAFTGHILIINHFSPKTDGVKMSCIQFFTVFVLSGAVALIFESPDIGSLQRAWLPICYAGIMSSGVGYTLQIIGQRYTEPTVASLLMSLESVFAVLAGIVILGELPSGREWLGCIIMFAAIVISQLPQRSMSKQ